MSLAQELEAGTACPEVSDAIVHFVAGREGWFPHVYNDPANHCTIGYGHLLHRGPCTPADEAAHPPLSQAEGLALLRQDMAGAHAAVCRYVTVPLNQPQSDALTSFAFAVGDGAFKRSTLLKLLNQGDYASVPVQLNLWVKANHKVLPGLVHRRRAEGDLFAHGTYPPTATTHALDADPEWHGTTPLVLGVPGGRVGDGFFRSAAERGTSSGRSHHLGVDVHAQRGTPVYALIRDSLDIATLHNARPATAQGSAPTTATLPLPPSGVAHLDHAVVSRQPWSSHEDHSYGGVLGLGCVYAYLAANGQSGQFTAYVEYLHLITDAFPAKDRDGSVLTGWSGDRGFGPRLASGATVSAHDLTTSPLLVGYLGATQTPHCHINAAFAPSAVRYAKFPRFDPRAVVK